MNNIVETYLMFKANCVREYINILALELKKASKIPKQINKLIYKYYDLYILSEKRLELDYELLRNKTGLNEKNDRLVLFYLLIEFDIASKTEYKNDEYYQFYNLIVNSIIIFSKLENDKVFNKDCSYNNSIQKILKKNVDMISNEYILFIDKMHSLLEKQYISSLKKELKFIENYENSAFSTNYTKIKRSNEIYLEIFKYKNDKLASEEKKNVELINSEFQVEFNLINIDMISMRILKDTFKGLQRMIFIKISNELITKKSNLDIFTSMIKLRFLKEKITFIINTSLLEKYEERINYLILNGFNISYIKDCKLTPYDVYKNGGYLIVDYDDLKEGLAFVKNNHLEIIANKVNKNNADKLKNIKYITL